jgi:hypothetical protein
MRRVALTGLVVALIAAALWFAVVAFPRLTREAAQSALPPVLAGGPTDLDAGRDIVTVEGRITRIDTAASGTLRITLRGVPDTSRIITAAMDSAAAQAAGPLPPPGTRVRLVGVGAPGAAPRLAIRQVLRLEIRE